MLEKMLNYVSMGLPPDRPLAHCCNALKLTSFDINSEKRIQRHGVVSADSGYL